MFGRWSSRQFEKFSRSFSSLFPTSSSPELLPPICVVFLIFENENVEFFVLPAGRTRLAIVVHCRFDRFTRIARIPVDFLPFSSGVSSAIERTFEGVKVEGNPPRIGFPRSGAFEVVDEDGCVFYSKLVTRRHVSSPDEVRLRCRD